MRIRWTAVAAGLVALAQATQGHAALAIVATVGVDRGPAAIAHDPVTGFAWVGNVTDNSIDVFAGTRIAATIQQADLNPVGIAIDPVGGRALVSSLAAKRVNVYSTLDRHKVASISVPGGPWGVAVNPRDGAAFVATFQTNELTVIARDGSVRTVALPGCAGAIGAAYSVPASRAIVTCIYSGTVHLVDVATLTVASVVTIGLGSYSWGVAASIARPVAYVANWAGGTVDGGTVTIVDVAAGAILATGFTGGAPIGVAVSAGGTPYVTLSSVHRLGVLDPASGLLVESIQLPTDPSVPGQENNPQAVAVHPSGRVAIVGNFHAESVSFVSTTPYL